MKVGILGAGIVSQIIGNKLIEVDEDVMIGTRNPSKLQNWLEKSTGKARAGSLAEATAYGEILFHAIRGSDALDTLSQTGETRLNGKILIDLSNSLRFSDGEPPTLFGANTDSLAGKFNLLIRRLMLSKPSMGVPASSVNWGPGCLI